MCVGFVGACDEKYLPLPWKSTYWDIPFCSFSWGIYFMLFVLNVVGLYDVDQRLQTFLMISIFFFHFSWSPKPYALHNHLYVQ